MNSPKAYDPLHMNSHTSYLSSKLYFHDEVLLGQVGIIFKTEIINQIKELLLDQIYLLLATWRVIASSGEGSGYASIGIRPGSPK